jgi:flagellar protein FlaG
MVEDTMPDPITPLGGPGQIQSMTPVPIPSPVDGGAAQAVPQAASVLGLSEAARKEMEHVQAKAEAKAAPAPMTLDESVKAFREFLKNLPSDLQFQPDQESGYVIFKVVNPVTQEVIRQYPPDEVVRMARTLKAAVQQGRSGIFLDKKL